MRRRFRSSAFHSTAAGGGVAAAAATWREILKGSRRRRGSAVPERGQTSLKGSELMPHCLGRSYAAVGLWNEESGLAAEPG